MDMQSSHLAQPALTASRAGTVSMREKILKLVSEYRSVTFAHLSEIAGFEGGYSFDLEKNLILWPRISREAIDALKQLLHDGAIHLHQPFAMLSYVVDGLIPNYPVAKRVKPYKAPHWLPVVVLKNRPKFRSKATNSRRW
ncbi:MAG: hypothetical protein QOI07_2609 [Verrucomicrobiota bacterium]|jgi:hypothetical protein